MKNKRDLTAVALAALVAASVSPAVASADIPVSGIVLAAGCAAHGCGAESDSSDSSDSDKKESAAPLTEAQLLGDLDPQTRAIYLKLSPEGKALALQIAGMSSSKDKAAAVKEAQKKMSERTVK